MDLDTFFFDIVNGNTLVVDRHGVVLPSETEAREQAASLVMDLLGEVDLAKPGSTMAVVVRHATGPTLYSIGIESFSAAASGHERGEPPGLDEPRMMLGSRPREVCAPPSGTEMAPSGHSTAGEAAIDAAAGADACADAVLKVDGERWREKAEMLRTALDGMVQGLLVVDAEDRVRVSNGRAAALLEVPAELLREGAGLGALRQHQAARGEFVDLPGRLRGWLETGDAALWEPLYERRCASGAVIEVRSRAMEGGGTIRTITDVTAQRGMEDALREGERRYRLIADNVNDVIVLADLDFTRRYVSPSVTAVLGHDPVDLVGGHPVDLVHPDDLDMCLSVGGDPKGGPGERALMVVRMRHRDGHWVWLEVSSHLIVDDSGTAGGIVATLRDVSARKHAEDGLRASEARHRALVDALPQMMVIASAATGEATYTNRQFNMFFGSVDTSREARLALVHPDDHDRHQELWVNARSRQGRYEGEIRLRRRDGEYRWHKMVMVPVVQDGAIATVVSTALDIHDIVGTQRELERTSDLLRLAQAAAGAGVWELDAEADSISLSPASARMHGLRPAGEETATVISLAEWKALVTPEDLPAAAAAIGRAMERGEVTPVEFRTLSANGVDGARWVQSFGHVAQGAGAPRLVGLHLDVTERREAEEALRASEAELRASEQRLALALDSGGDGLFDADLEHGTHWVSQRWVEHLGYGPEVAHRPMEFWWNCIHPDDFDRFAAQMEVNRFGLSAAVEHEHRLRRADGRYIWVLCRARVVARREDGRPSRVVGTLIDVSERKEADLRIRHMAEHDALTGLPNRRVMNARLADAVALAEAKPARHAVLVCDLDRFKAVNDTLGHLAGDQVLCAAAKRIRSAVRSQDVVARLGGDEFAVLLSDVDGREGASLAADRIVAAMREPIDTERLPTSVGVSIGAAVLTGDGTGAEEVFKRADVALYEAKAGGRNTFRLFEAEAHARATSRSLLAIDLPEAMRRGEFFLVYQPIVDITTGTVSSCEALMRWRHPERGVVSPAEFIPVAEETGVIVALGAWALREACREAMTWPGHVRVAVNVSTAQIPHDVEGSVGKALGLSGLPPDRLTIEVTESALIQDPEQARQVLGRLRDAGVRVALDDFGTGYSSLSYLRLFPFDKLKIDRSFIRDIGDPDAAAIVRAVVGIGERLGMSIVVEGVETAEQLALVEREGCHHVQGFLFSRPLSAVDLRAYLAASPMTTATDG